MRLTAGTMVTSNVRLVRLLGEGGMGGVWIADHLTLETQVAVKFISPEVAKKEGQYVLDRFQREAKAAAKMKSPHVVRAYDYGIMLGDVPYLVMELLEGLSLAERLERDRTIPPEEATRIVTHTARALQEAHDLGIVHRDIKPENIFLLGEDDELHVKVLDFGIAKQPHTAGSQALTGTHTMIGTPLYMSPEQLLTPKEVDHRSDLWALGVVAYEMLTGDPPFSGETLAALSLAICNRPHPELTAQGELEAAALQEWFDQALAKAPADRFASAKELAKAFAKTCKPASKRTGPRGSEGWDTASGNRPKAISAAWSRDEWMLRSRDETAPTGPVCLAEVDQAIRAGTVPSEAMLAPVGSSDWRHASAVLDHAAELAEALSSLPQPVSDEGSVDDSELETNVSVPYGNTVVSAGQAPRGQPPEERASAPSLEADGPSAELSSPGPTDRPAASTSVPSARASEPPSPLGETLPLPGAPDRVDPASRLEDGPTAPPAARPPAVATFSGASTSTASARAALKVPTGVLVGVGGAAVVLGFLATVLTFSGDDETATGTDQTTQASATASTPSEAPPPAAPLVPAPAGMVAVAADTYPVGCDKETHRSCFPDEGPVHQVEVRRFAIMRHEVTVKDYDACVATGVCPPSGKGKGCNSGQDGADRQPINCVSWSAGTTYCVNHGWRLPSEVEWEIAARGPERHDFPWGNDDPSCDLTALAGSSEPGCGTDAPLDVGSRPKDVSWVGALDMAGNVREWTVSDYVAYPGGEADPSRSGKTNRGGSYIQKPDQFAALHTRGVDRPNAFRPGLGFRCATDL